MNLKEEQEILKSRILARILGEQDINPTAALTIDDIEHLFGPMYLGRLTVTTEPCSNPTCRNHSPRSFHFMAVDMGNEIAIFMDISFIFDTQDSAMGQIADIVEMSPFHAAGPVEVKIKRIAND